MEEKQDDNNLNQKEKRQDSKATAKNLLNVFLTIIVLITVITGGIIYYSLYKYSKTESMSNSTNNIVPTKKEDDISTVADIIDTALNTNTVEENIVNQNLNGMDIR